MLYRAIQDGDDHNTFYTKLENKRKTLSFVKTTKSVRFGCYLDIAIKSRNGKMKDEKCFVFNIDRRKIYNNIPGNNCINNGDYEVLNLYNQPFYIKNKFLSNNNSYMDNFINSFSGFEKDYKLNNYEKHFIVEEMETFQIDFN